MNNLKVWESELPFVNVKGDISLHSSITIPVVVQGENKYLN